MFKKQIKKEVFDFDQELDQNLMKKQILEKYERNNQKRLKYFKWSLLPICLIVIIIGIIFLNYKNDNNLLENKTYIDQENNITLNINDLSKMDIPSLDADMQIISGINIPYPFKVNDNQDEQWFIIPSDLTQTKHYIVYTKNDKNSNEYDTVANYIMLITDGHERNIEVKYAKDQDPIRDYYFREENSRITTINGINLKIYKYGNSFYTIFSYNGYNFDIETSNITEQEFSNYIVSILK